MSCRRFTSQGTEKEFTIVSFPEYSLRKACPGAYSQEETETCLKFSEIDRNMKTCHDRTEKSITFEKLTGEGLSTQSDTIN